MEDGPLPAPVVFIHGVGGSARVWQPQIESFHAAGLVPHALDLLGYGGRPAVDRVDFEEFARDVETQIEAAGLVRPVLVGHSLGGMVAQTLLRRKPQGYRAVVLVGTSPAFGNPGGEFQKKFVADRLAPLRAGKPMAELAAGIVNEIMGPRPDADGKRLATSAMAALSPQTYAACIAALVTFEERANLGRITVPVLCLAGEFDTNAPPGMMQRMAGKIPGAKFTVLPGVGHLPNLEDPQAFDAAVLDFLRNVLPRDESHRSCA